MSAVHVADVVEIDFTSIQPSVWFGGAVQNSYNPNGETQKSASAVSYGVLSLNYRILLVIWLMRNLAGTGQNETWQGYSNNYMYII